MNSPNITLDDDPECCPNCGAELEKTQTDENVFIDNCPNCYYQNHF